MPIVFRVQSTELDKSRCKPKIDVWFKLKRDAVSYAAIWKDKILPTDRLIVEEYRLATSPGATELCELLNNGPGEGVEVASYEGSLHPRKCQRCGVLYNPSADECPAC